MVNFHLAESPSKDERLGLALHRSTLFPTDGTAAGGLRPPGLDRYEDAEVALVEAHETLTAARGSDFDRTISVTESLAELYDVWGKPDKAAEWRANLPTEQDAVASDPPADEKQEE